MIRPASYANLMAAGRSRRFGGAIALFLLALAIAAAEAWAAPGDLDPSFSGDGRQTTGFANGSDDDEGQAVAIQRDGKIVVAGLSDQGASEVFAVARFEANGDLDPSFSGDGRQTIGFPVNGDSDEGQAVAIQRDGKIVVAGFSWNHGEAALARLEADGDLDPSFSGDGRMTIRHIRHRVIDFFVHGVAIQPDGKIVIAGSYDGVFSNGDFALARVKANGKLDPSFSGDGFQKIKFRNGSRDDVGRAVAIQRDGKIVVAGYSYRGSDYDFALARVKANGKLDHGFSGDGRQTIRFGNGDGDDYAFALAIQRDGKIVVTGLSYPGSGSASDFAVARVKANGKLDHAFSGNGRQTIKFGNKSVALGVAIQPDGKIVIAGWGDANLDSDFALARLEPDGDLDPSFSGDGRQTTDFLLFGDFGWAVALQRDGKIVVAGYSHQGPKGSVNTDFAVARFLGG
ncbi:MAG: hypothetical protein ACR2G3_03315 [Solirubrobacterales bacterium]